MTDPPPVPLFRNRDYNLLWFGQVISELGSQVSVFVFPVLVLAVTGSAAQAGVVASAGGVARLVVGLPAGALVDRWNRKKVMLACEGIRAVGFGLVTVLLWFGSVSFEVVLAVAIVEGAFAALFMPAEQASLPHVVHASQVSAAVARNTARSFFAGLVGPAVAGLLLAAHRMLPFLANALSYVLSFASLLLVRLPEQSPRPAAAGGLHRDIVAGLAWMWRRPSVRIVVVVAVGFNFVFHAVYLVAILSAQRSGTPIGQIGVIGALLGVGGLVGAIIAPQLHARLHPYVSIAGMTWLAVVLMPFIALVSGPYAIGGVLAAMAVLAPTVTTTVVSHLITATPDELRGRMTSTVSVAASAAGAAGPLVGGLLVQFAPGHGAVFGCAAAMAVVALVATTSGTLRRFPVAGPVQVAAAAQPDQSVTPGD